MWGLVVNRSRDFARQGLGYIPDSQPELQNMLCRWIMAYSRSLMCHLRPGENLEAELKDILPQHEIKALLASAHRPNYVCQVITAVLKEAQLPGSNPNIRDSGAVVPAGAAYRMDEQLTVFAVSACCALPASQPASLPSFFPTSALTPPATATCLLQDVTGGCERILRTPIPLSYTR
jgi:predicted membrane chloride channel (bestrophin family)